MGTPSIMRLLLLSVLLGLTGCRYTVPWVRTLDHRLCQSWYEGCCEECHLAAFPDPECHGYRATCWTTMPGCDPRVYETCEMPVVHEPATPTHVATEEVEGPVELELTPADQPDVLPIPTEEPGVESGVPLGPEPIDYQESLTEPIDWRLYRLDYPPLDTDLAVGKSATR